MRFRRRSRLPEPVPAGTVLIEARELRIRLGGRQIVDGVSLAVPAGQVLAMVGPNGAGKSTLLAGLAGDEQLQSGEVLVSGQPQAQWSTVELAMRRAVLPQQVALSFPFTVLDVVRMGRAPWVGTPAEAEDESVIAECLAKTGTTEFAARQFPSLSGGERARVALARVLAQRAPLLLLDEPTAALDLHHQELVLAVARQRAEAGDGVVVVLHDLGLAAAHADQVAVLSRGRLAAYGPPVEVFTAELLSEVYHHEVEVIPHPKTGVPLVLPVR